MTIARKNQKINIYEDPRLADTMDKWDQAKLEQVVGEKLAKGKMPPTDIICKYFLDAIEQQKYGWFWECKNGNDCHYRHCLPPGYVLKAKMKKEEGEEEEEDIGAQIEVERKLLDISKCTPVTLETFKAWKLKKEAEKLQKKESEEKEKAKEALKKPSVMSGRALFAFDATLFQDDEAAANDEDYEVDDEQESYDLGAGLSSHANHTEGDEDVNEMDGIDEEDDAEELDGEKDTESKEPLLETSSSSHHSSLSSSSSSSSTSSSSSSLASDNQLDQLNSKFGDINVSDKKEKKEKKEKKDKKEKKEKKDKAESVSSTSASLAVGALNEDLFVEDADLPDDA
jgi:ssDNA-binding Zn-finger/Zn-ribbon topoisomerase 1